MPSPATSALPGGVSGVWPKMKGYALGLGSTHLSATMLYHDGMWDEDALFLLDGVLIGFKVIDPGAEILWVLTPKMNMTT